jgi:hypothetical protein
MESEEDNLLSMCRVTDAASDCPQNSSEQPMPKTIQTKLVRKFRAHDKNSLGCHLWHTYVPFGAVSLPEYIQNMSVIVLT